VLCLGDLTAARHVARWASATNPIHCVRRTLPRGSSYNVRVTRDDLVARRLKYMERQIQLDKSAVNVQFVGLAPEARGPLNRHGLSKLPIGQLEVKNWSVLDLGEVPDISLDAWKAEVGGLVDNPFRLAWEQFLALPQVDDVSDFHCVTTGAGSTQPLAGRPVSRDRRARRPARARALRALHRLRLRARHLHPVHRQRAAQLRRRR
jgi:hypothetical protein